MPTYENLTPEKVIAAFSSYEKLILTFLGFSNAGYEDSKTVQRTIKRILDDVDSGGTIVNASATPSGIGMVYETAKVMGFTTTGIVSMEAKRKGIAVSPFVDDVFYVNDSTWGGFIDGSDELSPTSRATVSVSDRIVAIGGGKIARDELLAARSAGKAIKIIPADKNHARAIFKAKKRRAPEPSDFRGAVGASLPLRRGE